MSKSMRPKRLTTQSSKLRSGWIGRRRALEIAGEDAGGADGAELQEGVDGLEGILEELAVVVDAAHAAADEEVFAQDFGPEGG